MSHVPDQVPPSQNDNMSGENWEHFAFAAHVPVPDPCYVPAVDESDDEDIDLKTLAENYDIMHKKYFTMIDITNVMTIKLAEVIKERDETVVATRKWTQKQRSWASLESDQDDEQWNIKIAGNSHGWTNVWWQNRY